MSPYNFAHIGAYATIWDVLPTGTLSIDYVTWTIFGVREILIMSLKLIKVYFKVIKNKINPWNFPKKKI